MKTRVGVPLVVSALALAMVIFYATRSPAPSSDALAVDPLAAVPATDKPAFASAVAASDHHEAAKQGIAHALNAATAAYRQADAERLADVQEVIARKQEAVPSDVPQNAPPSRGLTAEEVDQRDKVDSVFASAPDHPPLPAPRPEALTAILAEIAKTDDPSVRRGLSGTYRDMISALPPEEMPAAIEGLEKARAQGATARP